MRYSFAKYNLIIAMNIEAGLAGSLLTSMSMNWDRAPDMLTTSLQQSVTTMWDQFGVPPDIRSKVWSYSATELNDMLLRQKRAPLANAVAQTGACASAYRHDLSPRG